MISSSNRLVLNSHLVDNSLMYYSRTGGDAPATYRVIDAIGQVMRREGFPIQGKAPKWTPDGQQFVYSSCLGSDCGIILSNIDGSANHFNSPTTLPIPTPKPLPMELPSSLCRNVAGNWEIYRAGMDGSNITSSH